MKRVAAGFASILVLAAAAPAAAESVKPVARDLGLERAVQRCKENRGSDCESKDGLKEWLREDRAITPEEQQAAAGARRHRELCAKNKKAPGC